MSTAAGFARLAMAPGAVQVALGRDGESVTGQQDVDGWSRTDATIRSLVTFGPYAEQVRATDVLVWVGGEGPTPMRLSGELTAAASARTSGSQSLAVSLTLTGHPLPPRAASSLTAAVPVGTALPRSLRAAERGQAHAAVALRARCPDHRHLSLPLPVFDLLLESWDT